LIEKRRSNFLRKGGCQVVDLIEIIRGRRSIRKYDTKDVPGETVDQLIEAIRWAPSWTNCQCWEVVVVRDPAVKEQLQASLPPKGNPAAKAIVEAPVLIALCAKTETSGYYKGLETTKFGDWMMYDLGLATQNLCLLAHSLGLGTVIVGLFDHDRARAVVNVPDGYELVTMIPLGYPLKVGRAPKRRESHEFTHDDHF
jgi:nitroreductase